MYNKGRYATQQYDSTAAQPITPAYQRSSYPKTGENLVAWKPNGGIVSLDEAQSFPQ